MNNEGVALFGTPPSYEIEPIDACTKVPQSHRTYLPIVFRTIALSAIVNAPPRMCRSNYLYRMNWVNVEIIRE